MRSYILGVLKKHCECDMFEVHSGFEALRWLARRRFDLVIADINMPDINGHELVRLIRGSGRFEGVSILIISTQFTERDRQRVFELGANAFLAKPFSPEILASAVSDILDSRSDTKDDHE